MIVHIMSGQDFIPFSNEDKARQSTEEEEEEENKFAAADDADDNEMDAIDIEIKRAMEEAKMKKRASQTLIADNISDEDVDEMFDDAINETMEAEAEDLFKEKTDFQDLIQSAIGPSAQNINADGIGGHHKRQSTRLLLDSLRPSQAPNATQSNVVQINTERHITWGMILIELDNFNHLLNITSFERAELIEIIQNLIDDSLTFENQYVDHMAQGQFVLLTPVDIVVSSQQLQTFGASLFEQKEDRLRDIAASVLQHLSEEEEGLEFCMGIALQDRVSSDQEWFEVARESLEEMKAYREFDRSRKQQALQLNAPENVTIDRLRRRSNINK